MEQISAHLPEKGITKQCFVGISWTDDQEEGQATQQHDHHHSCLVSDSTILLMYKQSAHDRTLQQK